MGIRRLFLMPVVVFSAGVAILSLIAGQWLVFLGAAGVGTLAFFGIRGFRRKKVIS